MALLELSILMGKMINLLCIKKLIRRLRKGFRVRKRRVIIDLKVSIEVKILCLFSYALKSRNFCTDRCIKPS